MEKRGRRFSPSETSLPGATPCAPSQKRSFLWSASAGRQGSWPRAGRLRRCPGWFSHIKHQTSSIGMQGEFPLPWGRPSLRAARSAREPAHRQCATEGSTGPSCREAVEARMCGAPLRMRGQTGSGRQVGEQGHDVEHCSLVRPYAPPRGGLSGAVGASWCWWATTGGPDRRRTRMLSSSTKRAKPMAK